MTEKIKLQGKDYTFDSSKWSWGNSKRAKSLMLKGATFKDDDVVFADTLQAIENMDKASELVIKVCCALPDDFDLDKVSIEEMQKAIEIVNKSQLLNKEKSKNSKSKNKKN